MNFDVKVSVNLDKLTKRSTIDDMDSNNETESNEKIKEQQKSQLQYHIFQEALPKVNYLSFQLLFNEIVPMSISTESQLLDDYDIEGEEISIEPETNIAHQISEISINHKLDLPSHTLINKFQTYDDCQRKRIYQRLNQIGFQIGCKLSELLIFSNNPNLQFDSMDLLNVMKFICRDVWRQLFGKQIDNLKTNHKGVFYLFDYEYKPIQCFSIKDDSALELKLVEPFLEIPTGIIKGVLHSLGFQKEEQIHITAKFVDLPSDIVVSFGQFPKGINFNVQVNT